MSPRVNTPIPLFCSEAKRFQIESWLGHVELNLKIESKLSAVAVSECGSSTLVDEDVRADMMNSGCSSITGTPSGKDKETPSGFFVAGEIKVKAVISGLARRRGGHANCRACRAKRVAAEQEMVAKRALVMKVRTRGVAVGTAVGERGNRGRPWPGALAIHSEAPVHAMWFRSYVSFGLQFGFF
ncbi:hypothetical protein DL93DRAFT_2098167 [Clavulina sp. PMI_390]|nr:hypothetical protein DL93DRAFT_2098167 [Clavulina sp. PMI_390]